MSIRLQKIRFFPLLACRGFALVLMLCFLALLVVVVIGFISLVATERKAAAGFSALVSTRQLSDMAVGLAQGQINLATTQGPTVAWASQPGMIRTFDSTGAAKNLFKLYSAPEMVAAANAANVLTSDFPPTTWGGDSAHWTDMNAPVELDDVKNYPIFDPSGLANLAESPEGLSISGAPGVTTYQAAPMPVRWLYVLQNRQIVIPSTTTGKTATIPGATALNPIVGRIAFWTDDDSSKVNVNTASEGSYWDVPRIGAGNVAGIDPTFSPGEISDLGFAEFLPAQREYQRYGGHPATVSLSTVFPGLTRDQIYQLVPKVIGGGSNAGTVVAAKALKPDGDRLYANNDEIIFRPDRTDNGVGLTKAKLEQSKFVLTAHSRSPETNLFNLPRLAMWPIYQLGANGTPNNDFTTEFDRLIAFCASSGAIGTSNYYPYIFQRKNADSGKVDISIARNMQLLSYLTYLTGQPVPGFGGNFLAKYPLDRDQLLTEVFDYVRSTNLQDDTLAVPANRFTNALLPGEQTHTADSGYGWVVPSKRGTGSAETMGFGRAYTISEMCMVFICNAAPDDPATPAVDESAGSNFTTEATPPTTPSRINRVLGGVALGTTEKMIQAILIPEFFSAMQGTIAMQADMKMTISGLEALRINGQAIFPIIAEAASYGKASNGNDSWIELSRIGGNPSYRFFGQNKVAPARGPLAAETPAVTDGVYPFVSNPIRIPTASNEMVFTGGNITVKLYHGQYTSPTVDDLYQTLTITLPSGTFPIPQIVNTGVNLDHGGFGVSTNSNVGRPPNDPATWWALNRDGNVAGSPGRFAFIWQWAGHQLGGIYDNWATKTPSAFLYSPGMFIRPEFDTIRSVYVPHGDYRLTAASPEAGGFVKHRYYDDKSRKVAASLSAGNMSLPEDAGGGKTFFPLNSNDNGKYFASISYDARTRPDIPSNAALTPETRKTGDFDSGIASSVDGPYVNKPDEGDAINPGDIAAGAFPNNFKTWPYFRLFFHDLYYRAVGSSKFSPNRQVPSAGMFGSLPTGVKANNPWQTLLFRPQLSHPSASTTIPDHLFMDLFWMPVVEPYAISDRFSTAGKINMNYQIMPFTYIERATGLHAVLKAERIGAFANSRQRGIWDYQGPARFPIDRKKTLEQFQTKFNLGQIFKSASEICDIHIVPEGRTVAEMAGSASTPSSYWAAHAQTGENVRERIYTTLYPRLTTKSNTFTVHSRVQALKQVPSSAPDTWTEGKDVVIGEYRGSVILERFVDANNPEIPDYAANPSNIPNLDPLDTFYRWRVVENRQFAP